MMKLIFHHLSSTDSTNHYAKRHRLDFDSTQLTCIHADEQTAGRGRLERLWHSPKGNIYATFVFFLPKGTKDLGALTLLLALSLAEILQDASLSTKIKWPNDVQLLGKKLAGVLGETLFEQEHITCFLGIGINLVGTKEEFDCLGMNATSLAEETGVSWDFHALLQKLGKKFLTNLTIFCQEGFFPFCGKFQQFLAYQNEKVVFFTGKEKICGICKNITPDGRLVLELPDGSLQTFSAGDLSSKE